MTKIITTSGRLFLTGNSICKSFCIIILLLLFNGFDAQLFSQGRPPFPYSDYVRYIEFPADNLNLLAVVTEMVKSGRSKEAISGHLDSVLRGASYEIEVRLGREWSAIKPCKQKTKDGSITATNIALLEIRQNLEDSICRLNESLDSLAAQKMAIKKLLQEFSGSFSLGFKETDSAITDRGENGKKSFQSEGSIDPWSEANMLQGQETLTFLLSDISQIDEHNRAAYNNWLNNKHKEEMNSLAEMISKDARREKSRLLRSDHTIPKMVNESVQRSKGCPFMDSLSEKNRGEMKFEVASLLPEEKLVVIKYIEYLQSTCPGISQDEIVKKVKIPLSGKYDYISDEAVVSLIKN